MAQKKRPVPSFTSAQVLMRGEMEGAHLHTGNPPSLGAVFDEVIGTQSEQPAENALSRFGRQQRRAHEIALDIIDQHELVLSLKQWNVVQAMMEQAVMQGVQLELDS